MSDLTLHHELPRLVFMNFMHAARRTEPIEHGRSLARLRISGWRATFSISQPRYTTPRGCNYTFHHLLRAGTDAVFFAGFILLLRVGRTLLSLRTLFFRRPALT